MKPFIAVVSARFRTLLQYRTAAIAGIVTQIYWGCVRLMVLGAFFAVAVETPPMSFESVVVYVWLGQVLIGLIPWNHDGELQELFTSGSVAYEMLRPLDLYWFWFARTLAFRTAPTLLRLVPGTVFAVLILPLIGLPEWALSGPASWVHGVLFLCSLSATVLLSCAITMLLTISLFWMLEARGIVTVMSGLVPILAGMIVPLPLFPDWAQPFLEWQPFRGLCDVPFRIYSGDIATDVAVFEILFQFGWVAILILFGYGLLIRAKGHLVVQGG